jgi:hypothetical protein
LIAIIAPFSNSAILKGLTQKERQSSDERT